MGLCRNGMKLWERMLVFPVLCWFIADTIYWFWFDRNIEDVLDCIWDGNLERVKEMFDPSLVNAVRESDGYFPLLLAAFYGYFLIVSWLLKNGANVNQGTSTDGIAPLFMAAQNGHLPVVELLVKKGADVNQGTTDDGATPLFIAAQKGHLDVVEFLANNGADVNQGTTDDGSTPLYIAAIEGRVLVIQFLVSKGADVNKGAHDGSTPLYVASQEGHLPVVNLLVNNGAKVNQGTTTAGTTPLVTAAQNDHLPVVELLVNNGANVNQGTTDDGSTPLIVAAQEGLLKVIEFLVSRDADVNQGRTDNGATPLYIAAQNGHLPVVKFLVSRNANVNQGRTDNGATPLFAAAEYGRLDVVKFLGSHVDDVDQRRTDTGATPLFVAVEDGFLEGAAVLVSRGAKVTQRRKDNGTTPLYAAARNGDLVMVKILSYDIDVRQDSTSKGVTPLFVAAQRGSYAVVEYLIAQGANVNQGTTDGGFTPLFIAAHNDHLLVVELLVKKGADVDQRTKGEGGTPLIIAAQNGCLDVVRALLHFGADLGIEAKSGYNAIAIAARNGHLEIVQYLLFQENPVIPQDPEFVFYVVWCLAGSSHPNAPGSMDMLLRASPSININRGHFGSTPLDRARSLKDPDAMIASLTSGAGATVFLGESVRHSRNPKFSPGATILHSRIYDGEKDGFGVDEYWSLVQDRNSDDDPLDFQRTPLLHAAHKKDPTWIETLLFPPSSISNAESADPTITDKFKWTFLHEIVDGGDPDKTLECLEWLLSDKRPEWRPPSSVTPNGSLVEILRSQAKSTNVEGDTPFDLLPSPPGLGLSILRWIPRLGSDAEVEYQRLQKWASVRKIMIRHLGQDSRNLVCMKTKSTITGSRPDLSYRFKGLLFGLGQVPASLTAFFTTRALGSVSLETYDTPLWTPGRMLMALALLVLIGTVWFIPPSPIQQVYIWLLVGLVGLFLIALVVRSWSSQFMTRVQVAPKPSSDYSGPTAYLRENISKILPIASKAVTIGASLTFSRGRIGWFDSDSSPTGFTWWESLLYRLPTQSPALNLDGDFFQLNFPSIYLLYPVIILWLWASGSAGLGARLRLRLDDMAKYPFMSPDFLKKQGLLGLITFMTDTAFIPIIKRAFESIDCSRAPDGSLTLDTTDCEQNLVCIICWSLDHLQQGLLGLLVVLTFVPVAALISLGFTQKRDQSINLTGAFSATLRAAQYAMAAFVVFQTNFPGRIMLVVGACLAGLVALTWFHRPTSYRPNEKVPPRTRQDVWISAVFMIALLTGPVSCGVSLYASTSLQDVVNGDGFKLGAPVLWLVGVLWTLVSASIVGRWNWSWVMSGLLWIGCVMGALVWSGSLVSGGVNALPVAAYVGFSIAGFVLCCLMDWVTDPVLTSEYNGDTADGLSRALVKEASARSLVSLQRESSRASVKSTRPLMRQGSAGSLRRGGVSTRSPGSTRALAEGVSVPPVPAEPQGGRRSNSRGGSSSRRARQSNPEAPPPLVEVPPAPPVPATSSTSSQEGLLESSSSPKRGRGSSKGKRRRSSSGKKQM